MAMEAMVASVATEAMVAMDTMAKLTDNLPAVKKCFSDEINEFFNSKFFSFFQ
jgi:hypothetical protein